MRKIHLSRLLRLAALLLLLVVFRPVGALAQAPTWQWAKSVGGGWGTGTVTDPAGNVYVTGYFIGTTTLGTSTLTSAGIYDIFVAKLNPAGAYQWAVRVGGTGVDLGSHIALDGAGNVLVTGSFGSPTITFGATTLSQSSGTAFVAKLSPAGAWQWATYAPAFSSLAVNHRGDIALSGSFGSPTLTLGATTLTNTGGSSDSTDLFVAKLSAAGTWLWAIRAGGTGNENATLALDSAGNAYLSGAFTSPTLALGATTLTTSSRDGSSELFVAKLSAAGTWLWAAQAGGTGGGTSGNRVAVDSSGHVVVLGAYRTTITLGATTLTTTNQYGRLFVARLTPAGAWLWATGPTSGGAEVTPYDLALDAAGSAYVTGYFIDASISFGATTLLTRGRADIYVAKLSAAGVWLWATSAGSTSDDVGVALSLAPDGAVYLTGTASGPSIAFGPTVLTQPAMPNYYYSVVARLAPPTVGVADDAADGEDARLRLYPNPAHETVRLMGTAGAPAVLLDGTGRAVRTSNEKRESRNIDLRGLPAGVYTVRAGTATRRLMVE